MVNSQPPRPALASPRARAKGAPHVPEPLREGPGAQQLGPRKKAKTRINKKASRLYVTPCRKQTPYFFVAYVDIRGEKSRHVCFSPSPLPPAPPKNPKNLPWKLFPFKITHIHVLIFLSPTFKNEIK